jgi:hypothetical protein
MRFELSRRGLAGISEAGIRIEVAAQNSTFGGSAMSAQYSSEGESLPVVATTNTALSSLQVQNLELPDSAVNFLNSPIAKVNRPVAGLVGRCFLQVCLWVDLVASWSRRIQHLPALGTAPKLPAGDAQLTTGAAKTCD